jgi:hypothetical protein
MNDAKKCLLGVVIIVAVILVVATAPLVGALVQP